MKNWNNEIEKEILTFVKEWLKVHEKSQSDLKVELGTNSSRKSEIIKELSKDFKSGGISALALRLSNIERKWLKNKDDKEQLYENKKYPFSQLDFLLEEISEDIPQ